jgi:hypothetical protein
VMMFENKAKRKELQPKNNSIIIILSSHNITHHDTPPLIPFCFLISSSLYYF